MSGASQRHSLAFRVLVGTVGVLLFVGFISLGTWQVQRRTWKLDLIDRVEHRVHAIPVTAPSLAEWAGITRADHEYLRVTVSGTFLDSSQTLVQASSDLGAGYWVVTPLRQADSSIVLINRGYVAADDKERVRPASASLAADAPAALATVTGLLRITEPGGAFLRHNDPAGNHWYSRDVQAIAAARGLPPGRVAPYFIDAAAGSTGSAAIPTIADAAASSAAGTSGAGQVDPIGGLTVIAFHNSHLVYAITWYTLALMTATGIWLGIRTERRKAL